MSWEGGVQIEETLTINQKAPLYLQTQIRDVLRCTPIEVLVSVKKVGWRVLEGEKPPTEPNHIPSHFSHSEGDMHVVFFIVFYGHYLYLVYIN